LPPGTGEGLRASRTVTGGRGPIALGLNAVTVVSVIRVGAALVMGIYFITDK
jgi:hypothetical protein